MNVEAFDFDGDYGQSYEGVARTVIPGYETLFHMIVSILDPHLPVGARVLVVGAGTGIEIVHLKNARPDLIITGVDPSAHMLKLAETRIAEAGIASDVYLHHGYAHEIPSGVPFDGATLINVLHFIPDDGQKGALLTDISERLVPGGVFTLFDLHGEPGTEEYHRYWNAWRRYWQIRGMDDEARARFESRIHAGIHYASAIRILELAREAGFEKPRMFYKSLLYGGWTFSRSHERTADS